jgi:hypothetical protein
MATESFSVDTLIGEGAFGQVYRGQLSDQKVWHSLCQKEKHRSCTVAEVMFS